MKTILIYRNLAGEIMKTIIVYKSYHQMNTEKIAKAMGEFASLGEVSLLKFNLNLKGPLGWILGKNKGHPDKKDLENARLFSRNLI